MYLIQKLRKANKKILDIIIGTVSIFLGILCIVDENMTVILCGLGLILYGAGSFVHWRERRKAGAAGRWALVTVIVPLAFGVFILVGSSIEAFAVRTLLFSLSIWLIAEGVLEILGAVMYRKAMTTEDIGIQAPGSFASMVLGAVMAAAGVLGIIFPIVAEYLVWIWVVGVLILSGIRIIWSARSAGALEENDG